jgi:hypothetical protein
VKRKRNIEVEFGLTVGFGSADHSLAVSAAGEVGPESKLARALEPNAT